VQEPCIEVSLTAIITWVFLARGSNPVQLGGTQYRRRNLTAVHTCTTLALDARPGSKYHHPARSHWTLYLVAPCCQVGELDENTSFARYLSHPDAAPQTLVSQPQSRKAAGSQQAFRPASSGSLGCS